jgi:outer membrane protein assembly factor BamB
MTIPQTVEKDRVHLRLWPGIIVVLLQWSVRLGLPVVWPDGAIYGFFGALLGAVLVILWWLFFSRAPWLERLGGIVAMALAIIAVHAIVDQSIAGGGMGMLYWFMAIPTLSIGLVAGAVIGDRFSVAARRVILTVCVFLSAGYWALLRTEGITGEGNMQLTWRWKKTAEERLVAKSATEPAPAPAAAPVAAAPEAPTVVPVSLPARPAKPNLHAEWPGFRGPNRDSVLTGVRINPDWNAAPPVEMWRRAVGPGWSSFAVAGSLIFTQEQRGDSELVSCYRRETGKPVWTHRDAARFWESNGGPGPRGTPTLHNGYAYAFGATGIFNALDATTGAVLWSRNPATETGTKTPMWGFSSSPLVVGNNVIVAASGRLAAYDAETGAPKWVGPKIGGSYGSPHLATIGGVEQVLLLTSNGTTSVAPESGQVLWKNEWSGATILQPVLLGDGGLLVTTGDNSGGAGTRRLAVAKNGNGWKVDEVWTSVGLKPYFNDLVVHKGHAYGFDGGILACIDLQDGKRKWKGGRYGHGQMLLLADQDLLLILSEEGEIALVSATPEQFTEIAKRPALHDKTWNHPVLVDDTLLVRNGEEMVAFRLARTGT